MPSEGTLLTRFNIRRLRFAMIPVSHTPTNRATTTATPVAARTGKPNIFAVHPSLRRLFPRASLHHAAETLTAILHTLPRVEPMLCRPQTPRHHLRKMDRCKMAQRHRTETARPESSRVVCRYAT